MAADASIWKRAARLAGEVIAETLWPVRCALCDRPGQVLCDACARTLPHLDWWQACRRCGAAFGARQCDLCNPVALGRIGRAELPFSACASAMLFTSSTGQLVRVYKDAGEQRLASSLAYWMARAVPPSWRVDAVTFVPATKAAYRQRGFDHAELLARAVADELGMPCASTLARPITRDQRKLTGKERLANLSGRFESLEGAVGPQRYLLVDDVFTTGATLCAATDALLQSGARDVNCLTFARS